jgi:hypothetical protein
MSEGGLAACEDEKQSVTLSWQAWTPTAAVLSFQVVPVTTARSRLFTI